MEDDKAIGRDSTGCGSPHRSRWPTRVGPLQRWRAPAVFAALLVVCALATGCAVAPREPVASADFRVRGKIAVRGTDHAFSASFDWVQTAETFDVELWGPLGQGRVRLRGDDTRLTVTDSSGATTAGINAESFMASTLGWSVPISALPHWVRGRPDPGGSVDGEHRGAAGTAMIFEQFGWTVEVSRWAETALGPMPGRIVAIRQQRRIVIVCKEWSVG